MGLMKTIDGLLMGTRYLCWGIALVGIVGSIVLFFANLGLGFASAAVCLAALLLCLGVTLLLLPKALAKKKLEGKGRVIVGAAAVALAVAVMGVTYFSVGGFPALNLLFA